MAELVALVLRVITNLGTVLSLANLIHAITGTTQVTVDNTAVNVAEIDTVVTNPTQGVYAIFGEIDALIAALALDRAAILAAIAACQQSGQAVTLPSNPPSGWVTDIGGGSATAVWSDTASYPGGSKGAGLSLIAVVQQFQLVSPAGRVLGNAQFLAYGTSTTFPPMFPVDIPIYDLALATPGEDMFTFIVAQLPAYTWSKTVGDPYVVYATSLTDTAFKIVTRLDSREFQLELALGSPPAGSVGAPVWPGLSGVTLGTPVALSTSFSITGPLQGVILDITSVNTNRTTFDVGGELGYKRIGTLVFVDDNGDVTDLFLLDFLHQVYLPRNATSAAAARFSCDVDTLGTATPFTIP